MRPVFPRPGATNLPPQRLPGAEPLTDAPGQVPRRPQAPPRSLTETLPYGFSQGTSNAFIHQI